MVLEDGQCSHRGGCTGVPKSSEATGQTAGREESSGAENLWYLVQGVASSGQERNHTRESTRVSGGL